MVHVHRYDDVVYCDADHEWPDWSHALFHTIHRLEVRLMSQQDQINADVALLSDALQGIGKELQDFKAAAQAQAPSLDLSGLDAIAQKALDLVPPTQTAPATDTPAPISGTDTPVVSPTVDTTTTADAGAPVIAPDGGVLPADSGTNPAPNLNM